MKPSTVFILLGMVLCFASSYVGVKIAYQTFPPFMTVFLRYLLVVPFFLFLHRRLRLPWPSRKDFLALAALGLIEPGAFMLFDSLGMRFTTAGQASLMAATIPLFVVLMGPLVLKTHLHKSVLVSVFLSIAGIAVLTAQDIRALKLDHLAGNLLILCSAVVAALWTLLVKKFSEKHPPLTIALAQACTTLGIFSILALGEAFFIRPGTPTWESAGAVVYLGIVASGLGYFTLLTGIRSAGAVMASTFVNLIPLVAILLASLVLGEPITLRLALCAAFVVGAIFHLHKYQHLAY